MAAQSNPPASFGYTWGFADNSRADGNVVEISPNINYTVSEAMPYLQLADGSSITVQKDVKGAIAHTNKGVVRRMFVVNEPFTQASAQSSNFRVITTGGSTSAVATHHKKHDVLNESNHSIANGILDTKTVLTTANKSSYVTSPIGSLQLTVEECNDIMMKRAVAAAQQQQHSQQQQQQQQQQHHQQQHQGHATIAAADGHHADFLIREGISVQVQKVIQGLEAEADDQQQQQQQSGAAHCKLEPNMEIDPKEEVMHQVDDEDHDLELELEHDEIEHKHNITSTPKERPYSCEECGKNFLLKHHLTTHARVHTGERPHVCVHCGKSFAHKHCLNTHLLLHSTDRPYQCNECKKSFTLKHHLLTHSRVHSRDRPFVCQECGRAFPLKRHLVTHSKFHAGERPYVCEECGESFAQENHLVMHSRFHGSINPFVCADCGATFPRKFQLVNHGRIHGRVPHSCTVCGKEFLQKRTLVAHMRMHTGDSPYPCTACGDGFRTKAELNQHNRLHHGGVNQNTANANAIVTSAHQQGQIQVVQQQAHVQHIQHQQHHQQQHHQVTVVGQSNNGIVTTISTPETSPRPQYACRECGQAFNSREALALHLRLHTGDKSLMTDLCALTAALPGHFLNPNMQQQQGSVLTSNHGSVVQSAVPVQIISSTGQVIQQSNLVSSGHHQQHQLQQHHQQQHHPQHQQQQHQQTTIVTALPIPTQQKPKSHFCTSCGKGFASKHGLLQHHRRHPNGGCTLRTHVCECGKAFFQKNHLMLHQRQHLDPKPSAAQAQQAAAQQQQQQVPQPPPPLQHMQQPSPHPQTQTQQSTAIQQHHQQLAQQTTMTTREVMINNQPVQVQVLQTTPTSTNNNNNTAQVIKYEINIPQDGIQTSSIVHTSRSSPATSSVTVSNSAVAE